MFDTPTYDPSSNKFTGDHLNRQDKIENLATLLSTTHHPLTMSIDGPWGCGKTTFVYMLQDYLTKKHEIQSIYWSAWEDDYMQDPIIALIGALKELNGANSDDFEQLKQSATKIGISALAGVAQVLSAGVLNKDVIGDVIKATSDEVFKDYLADKKPNEEFRELLGQLVAAYSPDRPLIVFIDELDRCRPNYTILLLERIKHFFNVENLIFVFSIDSHQLSESIKCVYGNIDTVNYLRRFIEFGLVLNNESLDAICSNLYHKYECKKILQSSHCSTSSEFSDLTIIKSFAKYTNMTPRQIDQIVHKLGISYGFISHLTQHQISLLSLLICIQSMDPITYREDFYQAIKTCKNIFETCREPKHPCLILNCLLEIILEANTKSDEEIYELHNSSNQQATNLLKTGASEEARIGYIKSNFLYFDNNTINEHIKKIKKTVDFIAGIEV